MLFYENLETIVFRSGTKIHCDELVIISGYVGPSPVHELSKLPLNITIVYGMYGSEGIHHSLHEALLREDKHLSNVRILYSLIPIHSKCYIWKYKNRIVYALIGSANFTSSGLRTTLKEVLAETTTDTFQDLSIYCDLVMKQTIHCSAAKANNALFAVNKNIPRDVGFNSDICSMPLFIIEKGREIVPPASGLNWGMAKLNGSHVNINDAYIKIDADMINRYPHMFPKKTEKPLKEETVGKKNHRHNDNIDIIWDDGTTMTGLMEGTSSKTKQGFNVMYPKEIASTPRKAQLGKYLRERIGVPEGVAITISDLERYGRKTIDVSLLGEGIYFFDFSVNEKSKITTSISEISINEHQSNHLHRDHSDPKLYSSQKDNEENLIGKSTNSTPSIKADPNLQNNQLKNTKITSINAQPGMRVTHKKFGKGVIRSIRDGFVIVSFNGVKKQFQYPDAFIKGFLLLI